MSSSSFSFQRVIQNSCLKEKQRSRIATWNSFMRVLAGQAKGAKLISIEDSRVHPTLDQVKETLFNVLGHDLSGEYFLDLFGGFGAIGIETLSRGRGGQCELTRRRQTLDDILREEIGGS